MLKVLTVARNTRVAHLRNGDLVHLYGPGVHWVWTFTGLHEFLTVKITDRVVPIARGDPLPDELDGAEIVTVAPHQRAAIVVQGQVQQVLGPGRFRIWKLETQELLWFDLRDAPTPLADADRLVPPVGGWTEHTATDNLALVLLRDGQPVRTLMSGRYRIWDGGPWSVLQVQLALQSLDVAAQDLVTADQVPIRVKPAVSWRVVDPMRRVLEPGGETQAYVAVQLALREVVAARTLDQLVAERDALSVELRERAVRHLPDVGIGLERVFVKDVVLPGEIRDLVNRVTFARKEAEALAIKRREEVAATRQLANTAKLLEANPILLRLKELEALGELVGRVDKLVVVGGHDLTRPLLLRDIDAL